MPIISRCTAPGCETLTIGPLCVEHDLPVTTVFVRGRPWTHTTATAVAQALPGQVATAVRGFRKASARPVAARLLR